MKPRINTYTKENIGDLANIITTCSSFNRHLSLEYKLNRDGSLRLAMEVEGIREMTVKIDKSIVKYFEESFFDYNQLNTGESYYDGYIMINQMLMCFNKFNRKFKIESILED